MSLDPDCSCNEVRASLDNLQHNVERWAREETPNPEHIDRLTRDATTRIRAAALIASVGREGAR